MKIYILLSFLLTSFALNGDPSSTQEIKVYLPTKTELLPLYLGKIQAVETPFDTTYLKELEKVLCFDLNYNGATTVVPPSDQKELILKQKDTSSAFNPALWKSLGVAYVVQLSVKGKVLTATVFSSKTGALTHFNNLSLAGALATDRKTVHRLADSIHKTLFGTEGIATTQILFAAKQKPSQAGSNSWISEIWCCDWDGANAHQITREGNYCVTPVFIPSPSTFKSDRFLYVSYKSGQPKIFIASLKEGKGKRLIDLKGHQMLPAISLQRDKVAFISDASGRTDLFIQKFHPETGEVGKPFQLFSYPRATQASPTFSPDGNSIAFVSDKDGPMRIYTISASFHGKREEPLLLTRQSTENSCPSWSPDGKKLAYSAKTKGVRQIWIYDFALKEERQLTDGPGNKENPSWAPDSKHLVFNSTDGLSSELYIVNLNQPAVVKISGGTGIKHYPTWGTR